jgi:hypothetical protein
MALRLKPGTELVLAVRQDEHGFVLEQRVRVGKTERRVQGSKARRCRTEVDLWTEIEILAQKRLAKVGLEKMA